MSKPIPIAEALSRFIRDQGFERRLKEADLFRKWSQIAGDTVANNAIPEKLSDGLLFVKVENPAWRTELSFMAEDIRKKINDFMRSEVVKKIVFN